MFPAATLCACSTGWAWRFSDRAPVMARVTAMSRVPSKQGLCVTEYGSAEHVRGLHGIQDAEPVLGSLRRAHRSPRIRGHRRPDLTPPSGPSPHAPLNELRQTPARARGGTSALARVLPSRMAWNRSSHAGSAMPRPTPWYAVVESKKRSAMTTSPRSRAGRMTRSTRSARAAENSRSSARGVISLAGSSSSVRTDSASERATRFAHLDDRVSLAPQRRGEPPRLGALAGAVDAFEGDEHRRGG